LLLDCRVAVVELWEQSYNFGTLLSQVAGVIAVPVHEVTVDFLLVQEPFDGVAFIRKHTDM
jgi:hypothetical protein